MNPPDRQFLWDRREQAWYLENVDGTRSYIDNESGNYFRIVRGRRLYSDRNTNRCYYLDASGQRIYYDAASQTSQSQRYGNEEQLAYGSQSYGSGSGGYGSLGNRANSAWRDAQWQSPYRTADTYDEGSGVQTIYATGPAQRITEPAAWLKGVEASKIILGTRTGNVEAPDESYSMKRSSYFVIGRVFEILWAEPRGGTSGVAASAITQDSRFEDIGYIKPRKFVVVIPGHQHCSVLGIFTYDGQGVGKQSVKKSDHAMVFDGRLRDSPPQPLRIEGARRGEDPMRLQKIRVDLNNEARWHPVSRVNLSKTYTVEHNVKVKDIGMIHPRSVDDLLTLYWQVMMENTARSDPKYATRYANAMDAIQNSRPDSAYSGR